MAVIYHPIDTNKFKPVDPQSKSKNRVLFVGRLERHKGFHLLCDVLPELVKEVADLELIILWGWPVTKLLILQCIK